MPTYLLSRGNSDHYVTLNGLKPQCSCAGFKYHGHCWASTDLVLSALLGSLPPPLQMPKIRDMREHIVEQWTAIYKREIEINLQHGDVQRANLNAQRWAAITKRPASEILQSKT